MYKTTFIFSVIILFFTSCQKSRMKDDKFLEASCIHIDSCDTQTVKKMVLLCKIWGFVKYHHPAVAAGKYNWDFELFQVMPLVLKAQSKGELEEIIYKWIQFLGEIKSSKKALDENQSTIEIYPDISWIEDSLLLGNKITKYLINIKQAERNNYHYYVDLEPTGNAKFTNENAYSNLTNPDTGYRLLALFRYWNIIQYYFPYKHLIGEDWEDVLVKFIPPIIYARNKEEYVNVLHKLIASINDTHAILKATLETKKYKIPVDISFVEGKAVVINDNTTACQLTLGDIILKIEGEPIEEIAERRLPYLSASNYPTKLRELASELLKTDKDRLYIEFEHNGKRQSDFILCTPNKKNTSRYQQDKPLISYFTKQNILYLYLGSKEGGNIPENIKAKGVIIDLRCYPSQKVKGYWNIRQFYPDTTEFAKFTLPSITTPGLFRFTSTLTVGAKNTDYYKGKKIILVNEFTQSQAEFLAMKYRCAPNTLIVGSTTAGADGNVSFFSLPGGLYTSISGLGVYYPNGQCTQRIGILPDLEVKPSIEDIQHGIDRALKKAIGILY